MAEKPAGLPPIGDEERARRQAAVDFARTSMRLEGLIVDLDIEDLNERYIRGELSSDELTREIKKAVRGA